jgi:hypothetical protein
LTIEQPQTPQGAPEERREERQGQFITVGAPDESVAKLQLAARWAERYAPRSGDTMAAALKRFRQAYEYVDAITHGIEPPAEQGQGG